MTTERLVFRRFESSDLAELSALMADPEVVRHVGDGEVLSEAQSALWIERSRENVERFGYGTGAVIDRATDSLVGWGGFARPDDAPEELIYGLAQSHWRNGYGTELATGLVRYATDTLGHGEVRASVHPGNAASIAILIRLGFTLYDTQYLGEALSHLYVLQRPR